MSDILHGLKRFSVAYVGVLIACICLGNFLFQESFPWGDSLNMFSSSPNLNAYSPQTMIPNSIFEYISLWYQHMNGRSGQAVLSSFAFWISKNYVDDPFQFPSWIMRSLSLFFTTSLSLLLFQILSFLRISLMKKILLVLIFIGSWVYNPTFLYVNNIFDVMLIGYAFPNFLTILLFFYSYQYASADFSKFRSFAFFLIYTYLSTMSEHYFIAAPILCVSAFFIARLPKVTFSKTTIIHCVICIIGSVIGLLNFLLSPAQQKRQALLVQGGITELNLAKIFDWAVNWTKNGYTILLNLDHAPNKAYLLIHFAVMVVTLILAFIAYRNLNMKGEEFEKYQLRTCALCLLFSLAFYLCVSTALISNYLPFYSMELPCLFLAISLLMFLIAISNFISSILVNFVSIKRFFAVAFAFTCLMTSTMLVWKNHYEVKSGFLEVIDHSKLRKKMYRRIVEQGKNGVNKIVLVNYPKNRYLWTIEPIWGLTGYLRWKGLSDQIKVVEEADAQYFGVDSSWVRQSADAKLNYIKL